MKKARLTLDDIKAEVRRMDPNLTESDETFHAAAVMLSALAIGTNETKLAVFTGYSLEWIRTIGKRLRDSGIWHRLETRADWFGEDGSVSFWMDVAVALGLMERANQ